MKLINETKSKVIQGNGSSLTVIKRENCSAMGIGKGKGQELRQILGFDKDGFFTLLRPVKEE